MRVATAARGTIAGMAVIDVSVEGGPGRRLVLLHGFTQGPGSWDAVVAALDPSFEIVRVTLPGHGPAGGASAQVRLPFEAAAGAVADAVAEVAGPAPATWVGYSLGGRLALRVALDRPDLVGSLILLGATAGIEDADARAARVEIDERLAGGLERKGVEQFVDGWLAQALFSRLSRADAGLEERRQGTVEGLASALRLLGTGAQEPVWERLGEITVPVLLLAGEHDTKFSAIAFRLATGIGESAALTFVPGAGHAAHLERPQSVATILNRFLSSLPAST
jgi:2-succinyl-6-hydroxy-2,4-cyclohexadiene-1-carboxylate synthase